MSFSAKNGQPREAENQTRTTIKDYLVKITMTKYMETIHYITVFMTTPYLELLYEELLNCLINI